MPTYLGVWSLGLFSPIFFSTSSKKKKKKNNKVSFLSNSVRDQCAQWFLRFSLGAYKIPLRDHCNVTELSQSGRFVTIMSDFSHPVNNVLWFKRIINDRFPFLF